MRATPAVRAALKGNNALVVGLLEINLPGYDLRLLDGASELQWGEVKFLGRDPVYGSWVGIDSFADGVGEEAPGMSIELDPPGAVAAAEFTAANVQNSRVRVWFAVVNRATGMPIPDPVLMFEGLLDQPIVESEQRKLRLEYEVVTAFDVLMLDDEGVRLSDAHHQLVWPGELGLQYVTGTTRTIIWGPGDRPGGITYGSGQSAVSSWMQNAVTGRVNQQ